MSPPTKKELNKGFHGFADDSAEFLQPDNPRGNWVASASGHGYNARYDDDTGADRGASGFSYDIDADLALRNKLPDERVDYAHEGLAGLIDDSQPYDKRLAGGAPLTQGKGVGSGPPKFRPKTGPRTNSRG